MVSKHSSGRLPLLGFGTKSSTGFSLALEGDTIELEGHELVLVDTGWFRSGSTRLRELYR